MNITLNTKHGLIDAGKTERISVQESRSIAFVEMNGLYVRFYSRNAMVQDLTLAPDGISAKFDVPFDCVEVFNAGAAQAAYKFCVSGGTLSFFKRGVVPPPPDPLPDYNLTALYVNVQGYMWSFWPFFNAGPAGGITSNSFNVTFNAEKGVSGLFRLKCNDYGYVTANLPDGKTNLDGQTIEPGGVFDLFVSCLPQKEPLVISFQIDSGDGFNFESYNQTAECFDFTINLW